MKGFKLLTVCLVFYFLVPYLILFKFLNLNIQIDFSEALWAFKNSLYQSFISAFLVVFAGVPMSLGLFFFQKKWSQILQKLLLIPQILPSLFSALIGFTIWKPFPMGLTGIVLLFFLIHLGFTSVLLNTVTQEKLGSFALLSELYGIKKWRFFLKIYFPLLWQEILIIFLMVFIFCFSSFSIPLIAGGGKGTNLEVLIYEKIFINQNWSAALTLSLLQSLFLAVLSALLIRQKSSEKVEFHLSSYLKSSWGALIILIYLFMYLGGYGLGLSQSVSVLSDFQTYSLEFVAAALNSIYLFFGYLGLMSFLLLLWILDYVLNLKINFARNLLSFSTVLVGFTFYLLFPQTKFADFFKVPLAMSFLFFPSLFKGFLEKPLLLLKNQIIVARLYQVSLSQIIFSVLMPQLKRPLATAYSFLVIWFLSDFAIMKSLGVQTSTLGQMAESFLSSYRLSHAYLVTLMILIFWAFILLISYFIYFVLREALNVSYKKFKI